MMKWLKHNWSFLTLGVIVVIALVFFLAFWTDSNRLASLGSLFGFIIAALLVAITIVYVRTNQKSLELLQEQWEFQNEVRVKFGLREWREALQVWIVNYGSRDVVVTKILLERPENKPLTFHKNIVVRAGEKKRYDFPYHGSGNLEMQQHVQVRLFCESAKQNFEEAQAYTLFLTDRSAIYKVRKGLHGLYGIHCPKCKRFEGMMMITDGLTTFSEAEERQKEMEAEVSASCPEHSSRWMLTMEHVEREATVEDVDA
jgi:hypothetical protein